MVEHSTADREVPGSNPGAPWPHFSLAAPRHPSDRPHALPDATATFPDGSWPGSMLVQLEARCLQSHRWFSGRMLACHAGGPGSIPGRCSFGLFACLVVVSSDSCLFLTTTHVRRPAAPASVAQWLARSAVNRKVGGSTPPGGGDPFATASPLPPHATIVATADRLILPMLESINQK